RGASCAGSDPLLWTGGWGGVWGGGRLVAETQRGQRPSGRARPPAPPARKRHRGDPWWAKVLVISGALLMMLSGTAIAGATVLLDRYTGAVHQQDLLGDAAATGPKGHSINGELTLLMVGIDE